MTNLELAAQILRAKNIEASRAKNRVADARAALEKLERELASYEEDVSRYQSIIGQVKNQSLEEDELFNI